MYKTQIRQISIERRNILYDIRETRLVKVFFFSISFSIYNALLWSLSHSLFYTIRFTLEYEVTLCIIEICNIMYSKTSFGWVLTVTYMEENELYIERCFRLSMMDRKMNCCVAFSLWWVGHKWTFFFFLRACITFYFSQMCVIVGFFFVESERSSKVSNSRLTRSL